MKKEIYSFMQQKNLDAILIVGASEYNQPMNYFLKGQFFTRAIVAILKDREPVLFYRPMERDNAEKTGLEAVCFDDFPAEKYQKESAGDPSLAEALEIKDILASLGLSGGKISFSGMTEFGKFYPVVTALQKMAPGFEICGSEGFDIIAAARYTKDADELVAIEKMGKVVVEIAARVEQFILNSRVKDGQLVSLTGTQITIGDVKQRINRWLSELGGENPKGTIFSMGRDAGVPHNSGDDDAVLEAGKTIVFDFFPREAGGGYFYDFTRTWCIGNASEAVKKAYDQVREVQERVIAAVEPGQPLKKLQMLTCELFNEMGHETVAQNRNCKNGYVHSISHGLGLNIHERPFSGFSAPDSDRMDIGTVFTVEPGLYYPDADEPFGIRIEDTITIDPDGKARKLAEFHYQLELAVPEFDPEEGAKSSHA